MSARLCLCSLHHPENDFAFTFLSRISLWLFFNILVLVSFFFLHFIWCTIPTLDTRYSLVNATKQVCFYKKLYNHKYKKMVTKIWNFLFERKRKIKLWIKYIIIWFLFFILFIRMFVYRYIIYIYFEYNVKWNSWRILVRSVLGIWKCLGCWRGENEERMDKVFIYLSAWNFLRFLI